jgi:hypothetical protein
MYYYDFTRIFSFQLDMDSYSRLGRGCPASLIGYNHKEKSLRLKYCITSIERKLRMRHIRGIKGEAVVVYCEPLITKEMACHRLSCRVNKKME